MNLNQDFQEFVELFVAHEVEFLSAIEEFGFGESGLTASDFQEPDVVVQLGREPQRIDILTFASGLDFRAAYHNRVYVTVGNVQVPFISIDDLRTNKLAAGRPRDLADAADLPPSG